LKLGTLVDIVPRQKYLTVATLRPPEGVSKTQNLLSKIRSFTAKLCQL